MLANVINRSMAYVPINPLKEAWPMGLTVHIEGVTFMLMSPTEGGVIYHSNQWGHGLIC